MIITSLLMIKNDDDNKYSTINDYQLLNIISRKYVKLYIFSFKNYSMAWEIPAISQKVKKVA